MVANKFICEKNVEQKKTKFLGSGHKINAFVFKHKGNQPVTADELHTLLELESNTQLELDPEATRNNQVRDPEGTPNNQVSDHKVFLFYILYSSDG